LSQTLSAYNYTKNEEAIQMTERLLLYLVDNQKSAQILFSEHGDPTFQKKVMMLAHSHILESLMVDPNKLPINSEYLSIYIANGTVHVIQQWLKTGLIESPKEIAELIIKLANNGLSSFQ